MKIFRNSIEEIKFIRSFNDFKIIFGKATYVMPRLIGNLDSYSLIPPSLQIEPTNYCNLSCICCSVSRSPRVKGYMNLDLFKKIIDEASNIGVRRIHLYLHGEPTLHPKINEMIRFIKTKKNLYFHLTTNGMFHKKLIQKVLDSGVTAGDHILFSILGYSKEIHEKIMKGVNHEKVKKNVFNFLESRKKNKINGPVIETIFYTMPENMHELNQFIKYWSPITDHVRYSDKISESFSEYKKNEKTIPIRKKTCKNIWERLTIFWNGEVTLCCNDVGGEHLLGNLNEQSIMEIWNSNKLLTIKRMHKEKNFDNIPFCQRCDI